MSLFIDQLGISLLLLMLNYLFQSHFTSACPFGKRIWYENEKVIRCDQPGSSCPKLLGISCESYKLYQWWVCCYDPNLIGNVENPAAPVESDLLPHRPPGGSSDYEEVIVPEPWAAGWALRRSLPSAEPVLRNSKWVNYGRMPKLPPPQALRTTPPAPQPSVFGPTITVGASSEIRCAPGTSSFGICVHGRCPPSHDCVNGLCCSRIAANSTDRTYYSKSSSVESNINSVEMETKMRVTKDLEFAGK